jgi:hypothetical protein
MSAGAPRSGNAAHASRDTRGWFLGHFVAREESPLQREGDFAVFGPGVSHSYRSVEESLVHTVRWPSLPPKTE